MACVCSNNGVDISDGVGGPGCVFICVEPPQPPPPEPCGPGMIRYTPDGDCVPDPTIWDWCDVDNPCGAGYTCIGNRCVPNSCLCGGCAFPDLFYGGGGIPGRQSGDPAGTCCFDATPYLEREQCWIDCGEECGFSNSECEACFGELENDPNLDPCTHCGIGCTPSGSCSPDTACCDVQCPYNDGEEDPFPCTCYQADPDLRGQCKKLDPEVCCHNSQNCFAFDGCINIEEGETCDQQLELIGQYCLCMPDQCEAGDICEPWEGCCPECGDILDDLGWPNNLDGFFRSGNREGRILPDGTPRLNYDRYETAGGERRVGKPGEFYTIRTHGEVPPFRSGDVDDGGYCGEDPLYCGEEGTPEYCCCEDPNDGGYGVCLGCCCTCREYCEQKNADEGGASCDAYDNRIGGWEGFEGCCCCDNVANGYECGCCSNADCPVGFLCSASGICTITEPPDGTTCTFEFECSTAPEGACCGDNGYCQPCDTGEPCNDSNPCPDGSCCVNNACITCDVECTFNTDCNEGSSCINNVCQPCPEPECSSSSDCPDGQCCYFGQCSYCGPEPPDVGCGCIPPRCPGGGCGDCIVGGVVGCCPDGLTCCGGNDCCEPSRCCGGNQCCPDYRPDCCGGECCGGDYGSCCGNVCCPADKCCVNNECIDPCPQGWCPTGETCNNGCGCEGTQKCCEGPEGGTCCEEQGACCPYNTNGCPCGIDRACCNSGCCEPGEECCNGQCRVPDGTPCCVDNECTGNGITICCGDELPPGEASGCCFDTNGNPYCCNNCCDIQCDCETGISGSLCADTPIEGNGVLSGCCGSISGGYCGNCWPDRCNWRPGNAIYDGAGCGCGCNAIGQTKECTDSANLFQIIRRCISQFR